MTVLKSKRVRTTGEIFFWPLIINVICLVGVLAALIGDGWWDIMSWLTLGVPAVWLLLIVTPWPNQFFAWAGGLSSRPKSTWDAAEFKKRDLPDA